MTIDSCANDHVNEYFILKWKQIIATILTRAQTAVASVSGAAVCVDARPVVALYLISL